MSLRTFFIALLVIVGAWFLYAERAILSPFILAAVFAYLFNPLITLVSEKTKIPRTLTVVLIYGIFIGVFIFSTLKISMQIFEEFSELRNFATETLKHASSQLAALPDWAEPTARQLLMELQRSRFVTFFNSPSLFPFVSQAVSRIVSFFIFLFSGFYFLKDGGKIFDAFTHMFSEKYQKDVTHLLSEINIILNKYLRGEIFLILLMSVVTYIALAIVGVQYAVSIAIFSGFAEIVPVVGPITAGAVAAFVAFVTGNAHFGLSPINAASIIIAVYFVLRQLEDYFVIPHVMGTLTKLPPLLIFFAVIAGGQIGGILGLILAVPVTAVLKLLLEFFFRELNISGLRK